MIPQPRLHSGRLALRLTVVLGLAALAAPVASAASARTWNERILTSEERLVAGDYEAALRVTGPLLDEVGGWVQAGSDGETALGTVLALHALAEAGSGRQQDAEFDWYLAQSLKPSLTATSLQRYGVAGERLDGHRFGADREACHLKDPDREVETLLQPGAQARADEPVIEPPKKLRAPQPEFPPGARSLGVEGEVVVSAIVNTQGELEAPCIVHSDSPMFAYATSRALRKWRFRPARRDGEPVAVYYRLTVGFTRRSSF